MIRVVLLDVDNTLLDFDRCAEESMHLGFAAWGIPYAPPQFSAFTRVNNALWTRIEEGTLTRAELQECRWTLIFRELGIRADGPAFEEEFRTQLSRSHCLEPGAEDLLAYLADRYTVCFATNGFVATQLGRLRAAGLLERAQEVFISETIGFSKPDPRFFDGCMARLPGVKREETALIGDSLNADIRGGAAYGFHTLWYDREGRGGDSPAEFTVRHLSEIPQYL